MNFQKNYCSLNQPIIGNTIIQTIAKIIETEIFLKTANFTIVSPNNCQLTLKQWRVAPSLLLVSRVLQHLGRASMAADLSKAVLTSNTKLAAGWAWVSQSWLGWQTTNIYQKLSNEKTQYKINNMFHWACIRGETQLEHII